MAKEQWDKYFNAVIKQDWKTAKDVIQLISKEDKNNSQTFLKLGDVCQRSGDKTAAIAAYTHAAQLLRMQGFAQKALATYKIALRLDPTNPEIIRRAEILMDEFETARKAQHVPVIPASSPTIKAEAAVEPPLPPEVSEPAAAEVSQTSGRLEDTAAPPDKTGEIIAIPEIQPADIASMFESTSLTSEPPGVQQEISAQRGVSAAPEPDLPVEEFIIDMGSLQAPVPSVPDHAKKPDENEEWLESAYEALDTRVFKPDAEKPSGAAPYANKDAIHLIYGQENAKPAEERTEAADDMYAPLSDQQPRDIPEIFKDLPEAIATNFMNGLKVRKFGDNQHIIEEGDSGDSMFVIRSGRTKVIAHMLGRELELALLGEGDVFGEVGFLTGRPRTAAVIADGPVEVYEVSRLDIEKLFETNPEIIARIEDFHETRVQETIRKLKG